MKVIATNIGKPTKVNWNGIEIETGIFKYPTTEGIHLKKEIVENDTISDRNVHGGIYKACYLFSKDCYPYWKEKYPDLDWNWGMFGENLTVEGLNEEELHIGSIYQLGTALVQVTQPREPCFKLGIRFGNQQILKEFIEHGYPGTYVKVLNEGIVKAGDSLQLVELSENAITTKQLFDLLYSKDKDKSLVKLATLNKALPPGKRKKIARFL